MPAHDVQTALSTPTDLSSTVVTHRFVVAWQHPDRRSIEPVGFLTYDGHIYRYSYIRNALNVDGFQPLLGFPDLYRGYSAQDLFPLFAQRAMDPRRPDFERYLKHLGLEGDQGPLEQIARSQGRRQGDTIQLLPVPQAHGELTFLFLVNGVRHVPDRALVLDGREVHATRQQVEDVLKELKRGDVLGLVREPQNPVNPLAVVVTASLTPVGWVPDLLVEDLQRLMGHVKVTVTVEHVNGQDAPWHLRLLARLRASQAAGFQFFAGEKWRLLSGEDQ
jgi:hypothetical protein